MTYPCENEREDFYESCTAALLALVGATAATVSSVGMGAFLAALAGFGGGVSVTVNFVQWGRCLREAGYTPQADTIDYYAAALDAEIERLGRVLAEKEAARQH